MKSILIALLMMRCVGIACGQKPTEGTTPTANEWVSFGPASTTPLLHDAREYALSRLKAYDDYQKSKSEDAVTWSAPHSYMFVNNVGGIRAEQSFDVDKDGKIELHGITLEDAFLLLYAGEQDRRLQEE